jgi:hypothetical protein
MIRVGTFEESLPLLKLLWPDSFHIYPIDNPFGLVTWTPLELKNAEPTFFVLEQDSKIVASLHLFRADTETLCLRGISSYYPLPDNQWQALFEFGLAHMINSNTRKAYTVYNDSINNLVHTLGFNETKGPFWTDDWKVFLGWKNLNDKLSNASDSESEY